MFLAAALRTAARMSCSVTPDEKSNVPLRPHPLNERTCFPLIPTYAFEKLMLHCSCASETEARIISAARLRLVKSPRFMASDGMTFSASTSGSPTLSRRTATVHTFVLPKSIARRMSS